MKTLKTGLNAAGFASTDDKAAARKAARKLRDSLFLSLWACDAKLADLRKGRRNLKAAKAERAAVQLRVNAAVVACR